MKKHIIDKNDLKDFSLAHVVASSYGRGENKKLLAIIENDTLFYEIYEHGKMVGSTEKLSDAIDRYNEF
jgi:hypothetical protein